MNHKKQIIQELKAAVEARCPQIAEMCKSPIGTVLFSQDAFAADFQPEECLLLGMAIKYIGLAGKEIMIIPSSPVATTATKAAS